MALHDLTDDSGGRTEIIHDPHDLSPATTRVADELSKQYYLGYPASGKKDGRWHAIRVEVRNHSIAFALVAATPRAEVPGTGGNGQAAVATEALLQSPSS